MATDGKRTIFTDEFQLYATEAAATGSVRPGALVALSASGVAESGAAATVFGEQAMFADYDFMKAGSVDDAHATGDLVVSRLLKTGCHANVLVAAGQNITSRGTALSSNGDGTLKIAATDGSEQVHCYANEIINTGGAVALVWVKGA